MTDGDERAARERAARERAAGERAADRERIQALIELHEGRGPVAVLGDGGIETILRAARRIAVIGASSNPWRPSNGVFTTLLQAGYDCVPINPNETAVAGVRAFASLAEAVAATGRFDIVDVFRRSELCLEHAREAVAAGASCLWLQLGVANWEAARIAADAGLAVVMDRCTAIEVHRIRRAEPA